MVELMEAIQTMSGSDVVIAKENKLEVKIPIPGIGIVEEYGVSQPIRADGAKKPRYQVTGGPSTQVTMRIITSIEDMFLSSGATTQITNPAREEQGADALYNLIRNPNEGSTLYSMMVAGRSIERGQTRFTRGSSSFRLHNNTQESISTKFRLIRKATASAITADAMSSLLRLESPHVRIKEPLLQAFGLETFVTRFTKVNSASESRGWIVDIGLIPRESGYTTNRNLRKVGGEINDYDLGDTISWFNACYNPKILKKIHDDEDEAQTLLLKKKYGGPLLKSTAARFATQHIFASMVAIYAIAKARERARSATVAEGMFFGTDEFRRKRTTNQGDTDRIRDKLNSIYTLYGLDVLESSIFDYSNSNVCCTRCWIISVCP